MTSSDQLVLPVVADEDNEYQPPASIEDPGEDEPAPSSGAAAKRTGRRKINIEFIDDKSRRHITFSKRKAGIMKKAYELSTLTGTQVLLLVASETGHVYTFATPKLQPLITKPDGKNLIQACLNAPDTLSSAPPPHTSQLSPSTYQNEHTMSQGHEYGNQNSPHSPYAQPEEDKGYMQRTYNDVKPFQSQQERSLHDNSMPYSPYGGGSGHPMMAQSPSLSYQHPGPSLPTITDRGSFSNLPNHVSPYPQFPSPNMQGSYNPMSGSGPFPAHTFPNTFTNSPSQLFSKASNLPALPQLRDNENM